MTVSFVVVIKVNPKRDPLILEKSVIQLSVFLGCPSFSVDFCKLKVTINYNEHPHGCRLPDQVY